MREYQRDYILDKTHSYVEFKIMSDSNFDLDYVSESIGVEPSARYYKGDTITGSNMLYKCTMWKYKTDITNNLDLSMLFTEIQETFGTSHRMSALKKIKERFNGIIMGVDVVISIRDMEPPSILLNEQFLHFVNEIGGFIDIDMNDA